MKTLNVKLVRYNGREIAFTPGNRSDGQWSRLNESKSNRSKQETLNADTLEVSYTRHTGIGCIRATAQGELVREYTHDVPDPVAPTPGTTYVIEGLAKNAPRAQQERFDESATSEDVVAWSDAIVAKWREVGYRGGCQLRGLRHDVGLVEVYGKIGG